jgi:hypothetical protein
MHPTDNVDLNLCRMNQPRPNNPGEAAAIQGNDISCHGTQEPMKMRLPVP